MSDEDALLAAICADPADDVVRLAFADYLDESGDPVAAAWAQFVRANLRLGTGTELAGDVPTVLQFGDAGWLNRFAARARFPTGDGATVGGWQRGFPDRLVAEYEAVRDRWAALVARVPFRKLEVWAMDDAAVEDLVTWPRLDRLTGLELTTQTGGDSDLWTNAAEWALTERGAAALANCPALSGLESLELRYVEVTDRVADLILGSPHLRRVHTARLHTLTVWGEQNRGAFDRLLARFGRGVFGPR